MWSRWLNGFVLLALAAYGLGCWDDGPDHETQSPLLFTFIAERTDSAGTRRVEDRSGRLRCTEFGELGGTTDAGQTGSEDTDWTVDDLYPRGSECIGDYELEAANGLVDIRFDALGNVGWGMSLFPGRMLTIRVGDRVCDGWVSFSRFERRYYCCGDFYVDVAGGFEADCGDVTLRNGIFFSEEKYR